MCSKTKSKLFFLLIEQLFPNYVRQCLILPVPNSLTAACPFLGQCSLQWYHTGQEKPENKKQTNVIDYTVCTRRCFWRAESTVSIVNLKMSTQQPLSSCFGNSLCTSAFTQNPTETWHWKRLTKITAWLPTITSPDDDIFSVDPKFINNNRKHKGSDKLVLHSVWNMTSKLLSNTYFRAKAGRDKPAQT